MKSTNDQSLFAWRISRDGDDIPANNTIPHHGHGLLASSPFFFESSGVVAQFHIKRPERTSAIFTSKWIQVDVLLCKEPKGQKYVAILDCKIGANPDVLAGIRLESLSPKERHFARIEYSTILQFESADNANRINFEGLQSL